MDIALVDGRAEDLNRLASELAEYALRSGERLALHSFSSGEALLADYRPCSYAVVFLEACLEGLSGPETARRIREADEDVVLVFRTAGHGHEEEAIHYHVFDSLDKAAGPEAVWRVMDRILRRHTDTAGRQLHFTAGRMPVSLCFDDLVYLTADRNYLVLHSRGGREYRTRMTFSAAMAALAEDGRFVQILRGVTVNMDYIRELSDNTCCLQGGVYLPVSIRNRERIDRVWSNYTFEKIRRENPADLKI